MVEELRLMNEVRCLGYGNGFVVGLDNIDKTVTVLLESGVTVEVIEEDVMGIPIDENFIINYPCYNRFKSQGDGIYISNRWPGDCVYDMSAKMLSWQGRQFSIKYRHTLDNFFYFLLIGEEYKCLEYETDKDL